MSDLFGEGGLDGADAQGRPWRFVRVALERGVDRVRGGAASDGAFTYKTAAELPVGRRVEVTLGRADSATAGIVVESGGVELAAGLEPGRIKPIARDTGAGLPGSLVELARWMAVYYVCPLGMVLATMMPAAVKRGTGKRALVRLERTGIELDSIEGITPKARAAALKIAAIDQSAFPIAPKELAIRLQVRTLAPIKRLVKLGVLRIIKTEQIEEFGGATSHSLGVEFEAAMRVKPELTAPQARIVEGIGATLGGFGVHLLRGVTGSGKTEVYLRLIERVLDAGKSALVLVPEISLTPQTAGRFTERFRHLGPTGVAVLHSGLTGSQRHRQWSLASLGGREGGARVVVGARSAVFAPLDDLGLIVVDEEHAGDYKQDQLPRYHGRDVAVKRAQVEGCPVVLGSATPSLESWSNVARGKPGYSLWELNDRVGGGALPPVEIVDLGEEKRLARSLWPGRDPWLDLLGPTLVGRMKETFEAGGQAILLLNRRGYSAYTACPNVSCGFRLMCDDCDALMVHHRWMPVRERDGDGGGGGWVRPRKAVVRCHHCLAQRLMPEICPLCRKGLVRLGMGTQRLEEEIGEKFPELLGEPVDTEEDTGSSKRQPAERFLRVDGDTTRSAREWFGVLSRFASGELKLLLGTQMIAKGLDFPNVRLVGVVNADTALSLPDFRASERTFQLVSQVAGRAGRGSHGGHVVVQTMDPMSPAIRHAAAHDYIGFATAELNLRRRVGLPPATRMARIILRDQDLAKAELAAKNLAAAIKGELAARGYADAVRMLGPMPAPIARVATYHRIAIELLSPRRTALQETLAGVRAAGWLKSDARTAVDIDPVSLG